MGGCALSKALAVHEGTVQSGSPLLPKVKHRRRSSLPNHIWLAASVALPFEKIWVSWNLTSLRGNDGDWIGMYAGADTPNSIFDYVSSMMAGGRGTGSVCFAAPNVYGLYHFRYFVLGDVEAAFSSAITIRESGENEDSNIHVRDALEVLHELDKSNCGRCSTESTDSASQAKESQSSRTTSSTIINKLQRNKTMAGFQRNSTIIKEGLQRNGTMRGAPRNGARVTQTMQRSLTTQYLQGTTMVRKEVRRKDDVEPRIDKKAGADQPVVNQQAPLSSGNITTSRQKGQKVLTKGDGWGFTPYGSPTQKTF